jgi:hypothetical protein
VQDCAFLKAAEQVQKQLVSLMSLNVCKFQILCIRRACCGKHAAICGITQELPKILLLTMANLHGLLQAG